MNIPLGHSQQMDWIEEQVKQELSQSPSTKTMIFGLPDSQYRVIQSRILTILGLDTKSRNSFQKTNEVMEADSLFMQLSGVRIEVVRMIEI